MSWRARRWGWLAVVLAGCGGGPGQGAAARPTAPPRSVHLHTVGTAPLPRTIAVTGVLAAQEELVLGMQVGGRLQELRVDVGDVVAAGAPLAALEPRDFDLERQRAAAALATAHARLGLGEADDPSAVDVDALPPVREAQAVLQEARLQRERVVTMVQEQLRAGAELEAADAAMAVAQSRLQRARDDARTWIQEARLRRVELEQAQKRLADAALVAPFAGRVAARHVTAGQVVAAGAPVLTLLRTDTLRLRLPIPDRLAGEVADGQPVDFTVDGGRGQHVGRVVRLGAAVERGSRTLLAEAQVDNRDGALLPGGFCRAAILVAAAEPVVVVPKSAVVAFAGVERVFTVETGKDGAPRAKGVLVEVGRTVGDQLEIVRGLPAGTRIVREASGLAPEAPVLVTE